METLNIQKPTKERFIVYMGILQQSKKQTVTQDQALSHLLDSAGRRIQEDIKIEPKL
jgi:hypothetical protein